MKRIAIIILALLSLFSCSKKENEDDKREIKIVTSCSGTYDLNYKLCDGFDCEEINHKNQYGSDTYTKEIDDNIGYISGTFSHIGTTKIIGSIKIYLDGTLIYEKSEYDTWFVVTFTVSLNQD